VTPNELLARVSPALEQAQVSYMVVGSVASSIYGAPRATLDLDIVIEATREQLLTLMRQFPGDEYYADEQQALQALVGRSMFNIIDHVTGWKVDFIIAEDSEYGRAALQRRRTVEIGGSSICLASPEDVVIAKLRWAQLGASERQLEDCAGILRTQGSRLDTSYIDRWVKVFRLEDEWQTARKKAEP